MENFPRYWPFVRGIHRSQFPHKGQWRGALMFSLICAWMNGWVNNREAGDLRRQHAHYDGTVMFCKLSVILFRPQCIKHFGWLHWLTIRRVEHSTWLKQLWRRSKYNMLERYCGFSGVYCSQREYSNETRRVDETPPLFFSFRHYSDVTGEWYFQSSGPRCFWLSDWGCVCRSTTTVSGNTKEIVS